MRNRNLIFVLTVLVAAVLAAGCGSLRPITQAETDQFNALSGKIDKAIEMDAKTCAPKELANAQADLDHARVEAKEPWEDVKAYIARAGKSVDTLMAKIQECEEKKLLPTCGLVAEPETVAPGKCATLKWKGENVTKIVWGPDESDKNAEVAPMSGSKEVCPKETTDYQMSCVGKWSTNYEAATVTVAEAAPAPAPVAAAPAAAAAAPAAKVSQKVELRVNFDTDKAVIRPADLAELQKGVQFLTDNPGAKVVLVGHTDSRGSDSYNQRLSEARANAVKKYLEGEVDIKAENISAEGRGLREPIGDNKTKAGQFKNRRVEIQIVD